MRGWVSAGVVGLAVLLAVPAGVGLLVHPEPSAAQGVTLFLIGLMSGGGFVGAGLVARRLRPANRTGRLVVAIGLLHLASGIQYVDGRLPLAVGNAFGVATLAVLAHLVVVVPEGKARTRYERGLVVLGYAIHALVLVVWLRFGRTDEGECVCLPVVPGDGGRAPMSAGAVALWAYALVLAWTLVRRWLAGVPAPRRHVFAPVMYGGVPAVLVMGVREGLLMVPDGPHEPLQSALGTAGLLLLLLWPAGLLAGFVRAGLDQAAVGGLAARVGTTLPPRSLEGALGVVLHDPSLRLVYGAEEFVDGDGRPVGPPLPGSGRMVTRLETGAGPAAALVHDAALAAEPELVRSAAAVARLAIENEHMRAELAGQLAEVRASRARIVAAADAERRRIERNLHDGAQQRLVNLAFVLGRVRARATAETAPDLDEAAAELRAVIEEVRELARGLHPSVLGDAGLAAALASLADRSPVPVAVRGAVDGRLPEPVEQAAYFVAAEAAANALKHARAHRITIAVAVRDGALLLEVADDGDGGADPSAGTGLVGLADRAAALGGRLSVRSPAGEGTRVAVELPVTNAGS
ncbi:MULTISPECIES: sensor histidine kinase [Actinomadura]|uniref:histidine kinase n=1 Tax=Actinomadura yumaensis TaxID=111807 RepID=A0ABW2CEZ7_9ACTN|nr:histidine kinase [Actinomadura sp. J1-007]MWK38219.1 histidine kinase [Actinomadura sp. J1-007]